MARGKGQHIRSTGEDSSGEVQVCPLCIEPLDADEQQFYPCPCGYQVCVFCHKKIELFCNNLCPGCRTEYGSQKEPFDPASRQSSNDVTHPAPPMPSTPAKHTLTQSADAPTSQSQLSGIKGNGLQAGWPPLWGPSADRSGSIVSTAPASQSPTNGASAWPSLAASQRQVQPSTSHTPTSSQLPQHQTDQFTSAWQSHQSDQQQEETAASSASDRVRVTLPTPLTASQVPSVQADPDGAALLQKVQSAVGNGELSIEEGTKQLVAFLRQREQVNKGKSGAHVPKPPPGFATAASLASAGKPQLPSQLPDSGLASQSDRSTVLSPYPAMPPSSSSTPSQTANLLSSAQLQPGIEAPGAQGGLQWGGANAAPGLHQWGDPQAADNTLAYMARDAEAPVLLTHQGLRCRLPHNNLSTQIVDVDECQHILSEYTWGNLNLPCSSTDMMYLIYTSGSTGNPKGVMEDHVCLVNLIDWSIDAWELSSHSTVLLKTAVSFDPSVFEIFAPLALGGRLVIAKPGGHEDYNYMQDLVTREKVTWMIMVPTVLPFFLDACAADSSACKALTHLCCSGEAYPKSLANRACVLLPHTKIINFYGPTEATIGVSHWLANGGNYDGVSTLPIGPPMANTHLYVLDANLKQVPVGETGELYISGIMLARGYKGQPGMTADRFVANPFSRGEKQHARMYKTGDEAFWRSDGVVVFLGRVQKDQQVKLRGVRIELTEVEHHLSSFPGVKQALAVVHTDSIQQQHLVGYLSPDTIDTEQLRQHVAKFLPQQMIPESFVLLDQFPKMPNGKADRASLPEPKYSDMAKADYAAPSNETQEAVHQIWSEVLHHDQISISADFFQIGGTSLLAVLVASKMQSTLGVQIPASQLFTDKTIADLSMTVSRLQSSSVSTSGSQPEQASPILTPQDKSRGVYCTLNQEVMIMLHQLSPETIVYSMPFAIRLSGPLDTDLLNRSLQIVVARQEVLLCHLTGKLISQNLFGKALRGLMKLSMGSYQGLFSNAMVCKMVQKRMQGKAGLGTKMVLPRKHMQFKLQDMPPADEQHLQESLKQAISRPFNMATGPMIHATLIPISHSSQAAPAEDNMLVISTHYSVTDGWSMGVLFRDLSRAYNMLKLGEDPHMPELPMGFLEHAQWQHTGMQAKRLADLEWWCHQLHGAPLHPLLTPDLPRSGKANIGNNPGGIVKVSLSVKLAQRLRELAQRCGSSLFVTVLAAFKVLLLRYSGREDLVVGTPSAGRDRPDLQGNLVGCFVNLTMLRTSLAGPCTFKDVIQRVHKTVADGLAHADVPSMQIMAQLASQQKLLPFNALPYQVMFALHDEILLSGMQLAGVTTKSVEPIHTGSSKVDIFLELFGAPDGSATGHIEYDSSLWRHSSVVTMAANLQATLEEMISSSESPISSHPVANGKASH